MSRPPYPHRCLGGDPFAWACRCKATPDIYGAETARDGWGSGCPAALREALAEAEAALASGRACSNPLTALLDRLAEGAQVAAEEVDAAVGSVATFDSEAPALAGLGGEQMQRVRLEVACVRGDSLTPQARLREYRLRAERAEAERDASTAALTALRTYLTRSVADDTTIHEAWEILHNLAPEDLSLVLKWVDEIDGRPKGDVHIPIALFHRMLSAGLKDAEGDVLEWITARVERCAEVEAENATLEDMSDRLDRQAVGMTEAFERLEAEARRLRDLVRHQRGALHDAELITDAEYAALAADAGAVARLRGYDEMRRESRADADEAVAAAMEARAKELDAKADAALAAADKAEEAGDEEREDAESARWTAYRVAARIVRGA